MTSRYIAVDWGSTNLRAWLIEQDRCQASRQSEAGVTRLNGKSPQSVLAEITHGWRDSATPVVMAGMVGSNVGWKNVPYLTLPVRLDTIGEQLTPVDDNVLIVPGLCVRREENHNVMRGEETQLIGALALAPASLYVMPGTHCKWVQADSARIVDFHTVMTGELHAVLLRHSLIGAGLPEQQPSPAAFSAGLARGLATPALLPELFTVRAEHILGSLAPEAVSEFLSGLLIGAEVATMRERFSPQPITLVGGEALANRYQQALAAVGYQATVLAGDTAFQAGIRSIVNAMAN